MKCQLLQGVLLLNRTYRSIFLNIARSRVVNWRFCGDCWVKNGISVKCLLYIFVNHYHKNEEGNMMCGNNNLSIKVHCKFGTMCKKNFGKVSMVPGKFIFYVCNACNIYEVDYILNMQVSVVVNRYWVKVVKKTGDSLT
jgi:hypothetical protein